MEGRLFSSSTKKMELATRKQYRYPEYDYSQPGYYFVTICTHKKVSSFGAIHNEEMHLNRIGEIALTVWTSLPQRFTGIMLDKFVIMPNHIHGIVQFIDVVKYAMNKEGKKLALGNVISTFKGAVSYQARRAADEDFAWQSRFYESIIKSDQGLEAIRTYIANNPSNWHKDTLFQH